MRAAAGTRASEPTSRNVALGRRRDNDIFGTATTTTNTSQPSLPKQSSISSSSSTPSQVGRSLGDEKYSVAAGVPPRATASITAGGGGGGGGGGGAVRRNNHTNSGDILSHHSNQPSAPSSYPSSASSVSGSSPVAAKQGTRIGSAARGGQSSIVLGGGQPDPVRTGRAMGASRISNSSVFDSNDNGTAAGRQGGRAGSAGVHQQQKSSVFAGPSVMATPPSIASAKNKSDIFNTDAGVPPSSSRRSPPPVAPAPYASNNNNNGPSSSSSASSSYAAANIARSSAVAAAPSALPASSRVYDADYDPNDDQYGYDDDYRGGGGGPADGAAAYDDAAYRMDKANAGVASLAIGNKGMAGGYDDDQYDVPSPRVAAPVSGAPVGGSFANKYSNPTGASVPDGRAAGVSAPSASSRQSSANQKNRSSIFGTDEPAAAVATSTGRRTVDRSSSSNTGARGGIGMGTPAAAASPNVASPRRIGGGAPVVASGPPVRANTSVRVAQQPGGKSSGNFIGGWT